MSGGRCKEASLLWCRVPSARLWVMFSTFLLDNGTRKGLEKFLKAASSEPETVLHYEFMQDYKESTLCSHGTPLETSNKRACFTKRSRNPVTAKTYTVAELQSTTNSFSEDHLLAEGSLGSVFNAGFQDAQAEQESQPSQPGLWFKTGQVILILAGQFNNFIEHCEVVDEKAGSISSLQGEIYLIQIELPPSRGEDLQMKCLLELYGLKSRVIDVQLKQNVELMDQIA
ncbi:hypothetical protein IFM89_002354 [Coptis chinensis]|uniref:Uncharacterized protein n=1 Tax=Coptis chinensis TaxID=261450 RepID=A0A835IK49_9MAGN|nr:hypothetical protein IFM89_002354 [Coptis chinensis]